MNIGDQKRRGRWGRDVGGGGEKRRRVGEE
jgi:hypothetical protein